MTNSFTGLQRLAARFCLSRHPNGRQMQGPSHEAGLEGSHAPAHILQQRRPFAIRCLDHERVVMQSTVVRLLMGLGMLILAFIFTGILAIEMEKRAVERRPIDETYVPPKIPRY